MSQIDKSHIEVETNTAREKADRIIFKLDDINDLTGLLDDIVIEHTKRLEDDPNCDYELFMKDICHTIAALQLAISILKDDETKE